MRWPIQLKRLRCIVGRPLQFWFWCTVQCWCVEEYTSNIDPDLCIEGSDFDCLADFSAVKNCFQCFESKFPSNLHFFYLSLHCRIISSSSVLDSLITRLRFARVDGVVSFILFVWLWLPNLYHLHISDRFRNSFRFRLSVVIVIFAFFW